MFRISPINDKELQEKYALACGAKFRADFFAYAMINVETDELMGFSQFEIDSKGGYIADLRSRIGYSDFEAMFILGRATMNFIDLCGMHTCRAAADAGERRLLLSIGFKDTDSSELFADMSGMFDGKCDGHEIKL